VAGATDRGLRYRVLRRFRGLRRFGATPRLIPEGAAGVMVIGHRDYVGGMWEEMGQLQFDFLLSRGLQPRHVLLDIACGSLRAGVHFIRYLDRGNYLGIDKEKVLIQRALSKELPREVREEKCPEFVTSDAFEFERFSRRPDFSLAQSLFTHLNPGDVERCLVNLRAFVAPQHQLYATFAPGANSDESRSHARGSFYYSSDELAAIGERTGWRCDYIGDWGHPRKQVMMQFTAA
jgi:SAM-dependent methyltransferase